MVSMKFPKKERDEIKTMLYKAHTIPIEVVVSCLLLANSQRVVTRVGHSKSPLMKLPYDVARVARARVDKHNFTQWFFKYM